MKSYNIIRSLESLIQSRLFEGKAIILLNPRQTGKTTLIKSKLRQNEENIDCYAHNDV